MSEASWRQWDAFVAGHPAGGFMQASAWVRCRQEDGFQPLAVIVRDAADQSVVGGAVLGRRRFDWGRRCFYYVQDGPLLPGDPGEARQVMAAIVARIRREHRFSLVKVSHLRIEPHAGLWPADLLAPAAFEQPGFDDRFREPRQTLCVDLRLDEAGRLAAMKPKGRYNIGLARRRGVTVVRDDSAGGFSDFLAIQHHSDRRNGLGLRPPAYYRSILDAFGGSAGLYFAEADGQRLAAALVVFFGRRATYFFGGSLEQRRDLMAPYLLHHEIMNAASAAGYHTYDFWGVAPPDQPDHRWAGISAFKRKFGGVEVAHVPTLDLVLDRAAYRRFAEVEGEGVAEREGEGGKGVEAGETGRYGEGCGR